MPGGVQSIERAFAVLRALSVGSAGVTELADATGLPKSTVSRLLAALESERAVAQLEVGGDYEIGPGLVELAAAGADDATVGAIVRPFLTDLAEQTGGSAGFTLREGDRVVWIDNVDAGDEVVHVSDLTGRSFPLHTVPSGLAVLAELDDESVERYLRRDLEDDEVSAFGSSEPPSADQVRRRIAAVRATGVAASFGDLLPDVNGFAVALRDASGVVGGLYLQGPSFRFPEPGAEQAVADALLAVRDQVNQRLIRR